MIELMKNIVSCSLILIASLYIWSIIFHKKIPIKEYKFYFVFFVHMMAILLNYFYFDSFLKMITSIIILISLCYCVFKESINRSIIGALEAQGLGILSEMLYLITMTFFTNFDVERLIQTTFGQLTTNLIVAVLMICFIKMPLTKNICNKLMNNSEKISKTKLIMIIVGLIGIIDILLISVYYKVNVLLLMLINSTFILFSSYIVYKILEEKNLNVQYRNENDSLHDSLNTYENMIDQHRVINHENKNQLGTIKEMIENKDATVVQYIDRLVKSTYERDDSILEKTKRIPSGGLQGIIYQKLLLMKERDIPFALNISRDIKMTDFKKLDMDTNIDLCKIVGVFLDNAIEEVERVENKKILVDVYMEDNSFCVRVTNDYAPGVDFSKIDEKGYTNKTNGHGYGLTLVKELVEGNSRFSNPRMINRKTFSQIIMVHDMSIDEQ